MTGTMSIEGTVHRNDGDISLRMCAEYNLSLGSLASLSSSRKMRIRKAGAIHPPHVLENRRPLRHSTKIRLAVLKLRKLRDGDLVTPIFLCPVEGGWFGIGRSVCFLFCSGNACVSTRLYICTGTAWDTPLSVDTPSVDGGFLFLSPVVAQTL